MKKKDIQGNLDLKIDMNNSIPYEYFYKKVRNKVYQYRRINNGEWERILTPFKEEPYIYWRN